MVPRARFVSLESWASCGDDPGDRPPWQRASYSCRRLVGPFMVWGCLGLSASIAAPREGLRPGYGSFDDPSQRQAQVETDYRGTWHAFRTTTDELMKTLGAANGDAALLLTQIQTNAAFLDAKWTVWFNNHRMSSQYALQDDYLSALHGDLRVLRRLKKEKDSHAGQDRLRDVAIDVQIKADNCRNSADGLGKEIKVKVHTKSGGKEIPGFEVYYVPKGLLDVKSAHDRFPRQSSPTDEKVLNPGRYAMWARKQGFMGEPETLSIGGHGETRLEIDLEVPAE